MAPDMEMEYWSGFEDVGGSTLEYAGCVRPDSKNAGAGPGQSGQSGILEVFPEILEALR